VYEKCKDFFAQQNAERGENLKKKTALAERAEALQDSTDWVRTADAIKQLQAEWKTIGPVSRGHERAIWERFRAACDKFFTRRQDDLKQRKHDWTENLRRKEALVAEAEQLSQSSEWEKAAARIKQLQVEWKTIGPVKRSKSEAIWERFRAACDLFFERFKNRDQVALQGKVADRETAVAELEAFVPADEAADAPMPADLYAHVQAARARWCRAPSCRATRSRPLRPGERRDAEAGHALAAPYRHRPDPAARASASKLIARWAPARGSAEPVKNLYRPSCWLAVASPRGQYRGAPRRQAETRASAPPARCAAPSRPGTDWALPVEERALQERFDRAVRKFFEIKRRSVSRV
jgi:hypothetical protein